MKILGLDVSTKSTGWFVTRRSCGKIVPDKKLSFGEKLVFFRKELDKLLKHDLWWDADTCLKYGLVDEII